MARKPALGFIFVTLVLDILGIGLIVPILPKLVEELAGGGAETGAYLYGVLLGLYALMQFLFAPILGSLSDWVGRRPVILLSLLGAGLDYFLLAWAPTLGWFFIGRIISGITGANISAASAYIADISPPEKRAANFGIIGAAFGLGFAVGPALGGWLGTFGLRVPFIAAGVLTLINWAYGMFVLPESLKPENKRKFSWKRSNPINALLDLKRYPIVYGLAATYFLLNLGHQVFPATWVLYTGHRFGWGTREAGLSLALVGVMAMIVQGGLARRIIPKFGERKTAVFGMLISMVTLAAYGEVPSGWMIFPIIVIGAFGGLTTPAVQGIISRAVGDDEQGGIQGSLASLQSVAGFIGPIIMTLLYGHFISESVSYRHPGAPYFFAALLTVLALVFAKRSFRKVPQDYPSSNL